jgi:hypothetical protein
MRFKLDENFGTRMLPLTISGRSHFRHDGLR